MLRRRRLHLLLRGATAFGKLQLRPAPRHDEPTARRQGARRVAQALQGFGDRGGAGPVNLGGVGEARADGVDMGIDEAGDHRAALQVDHHSLRRRRRAQGHALANRRDAPLAHQHGAGAGQARLQRDERPVHEEPVGGADGGGRQQGQRQQGASHVRCRTQLVSTMAATATEGRRCTLVCLKPSLAQLTVTVLGSVSALIWVR